MRTDRTTFHRPAALAVALAAFVGSPWAQTVSCVAKGGNDRCAQCAPKLAISPSVADAKVGQPVVLAIAFPGLSLAGDCTMNEEGSVLWESGALASLPMVPLPAKRACGDDGGMLFDTRGGNVFKMTYTYKKAGNYQVPVSISSTREYKSALSTDVYQCQVRQMVTIQVK